MIDTWVIELKAVALEKVVESWDHQLPAYRETMIQCAKLERMAKEFKERFPRFIMFSLGQERGIGKVEGQHKHRLHQQNKLTDKLVRKLMEQKYVSEYGDMTANQVRTGIKKFVEDLNGMVHDHLNNALLANAQEQLKRFDPAVLQLFQHKKKKKKKKKRRLGA